MDEIKLLVVIIKNDLSDTRKVIGNCLARMWLFRNRKKYGASEEQMLEIYTQVMSVAEMAYPVWNSGLTVQEVCSLEQIQRAALTVIRGECYTN